MTEIQEKLLELLIDIHDICQREGISYYLCKQTALGAYKQEGFFANCNKLDVAMTTTDARRFMAAVKKEGRTDRVLDSMCTNKNYPSFTMRYGDANTLMMMPYDLIKALPTISVIIHMIRYKPRHLACRYRISKKIWKLCNCPVSSAKSVKRRAVLVVCRAFKNLLAGKWFGRLLFKSWLSMHEKKGRSKQISICAGYYRFDPALLKDRQLVNFEGHAFYTFGDLQNYLETAFKRDVEAYNPTFSKPSSSLLISTHVSYATYLDRVHKELNYNKMRQKKMKLDILQTQISYYNRKINGYYAIVDRTQKRFAMYEQYMPMKEQLVQLHKEERFEELNELLKPYRSALWACYKKGLALCFDKDIFEMTMDILLMEGSKSYVRKLRAMVPEQHWAPMVITDYKGDPIDVR